jgi:hypothetical protein
MCLKDEIDENGERKTKKESIVLITKKYHTVTKDNIKEVLRLEADELEAKYGDELCGEASGWYAAGAKSASVDAVSTNPARASSYIPTPERFSNPKCGLINIRNTDQRCFAYCMKYHQSDKKKKVIELQF